MRVLRSQMSQSQSSNLKTDLAQSLQMPMPVGKLKNVRKIKDQEAGEALQRLMTQAVLLAAASSKEPEQSQSFENPFKDTIQEGEVSSSSPLIKRNLSLYQQLTQTNKIKLDLPSSSVEKRAIQQKWTNLPSPFPFPTRKHYMDRLKSAPDKTTLQRVRPNNYKKQNKRVASPKSNFSLKKWLSSVLVTNSAKQLDHQNIKPEIEQVSRNLKPYSSTSEGYVVLPQASMMPQNMALLSTTELEKEVQAYRIFLNQLRVTNENLACKNERLKTLIEIRSSTCLDFVNPNVASWLANTIFSEPAADIERKPYAKSIQKAIIIDVNKYKSLSKLKIDQNFDQDSIGGCSMRWNRNSSKSSVVSQETIRIWEADDTMSSSSTVSTISADEPFFEDKAAINLELG